MKCHNCDNETETREWEFWPYGKNESETVYTGQWCENCKAMVSVKEEE